MTKCHGKFLVATTTFFLDKRSLHNSHGDRSADTTIHIPSHYSIWQVTAPVPTPIIKEIRSYRLRPAHLHMQIFKATPVPSPPQAEKSSRIPETRCNFFGSAEKMPKDKNEDAIAASPFKKNLFCAAFLADITLHQEIMHLTTKNRQSDDALQTVDLHPQIHILKFPLPSEKIRILESHNPHSGMHKFNTS